MVGRRSASRRKKRYSYSGGDNIFCDYQLTYLYGLSREILGEIVGNRIRISIPSLIDNFGRVLVDETIGALNIILLHELCHWGDESDYGDDLRHTPKWNGVLETTIIW